MEIPGVAVMAIILGTAVVTAILLNVIEDQIARRQFERYDVMTKFKCPCQVCPMCDYDKDYDYHPDDGLAYCPCGWEWVVPVGLGGNQKCPQSAEELQEWRDYDIAVLEAGRNELLRAQEGRERLSDLSLL